MRHIYKYKILNPSLYRRVRYKLKHNYDEYDEGVWMDPYLSLQNSYLTYLRERFVFFTSTQPQLFDIDYSVQHSLPLFHLTPQNSLVFDQMRWQNLNFYYEQCLRDGTKVVLINHEGQLYYYKRHLSVNAIKKYLTMQERGIGVRVLWYSFEGGWVVMEAGIVLTQFVRLKMNVPELAYSLLAQANYIQITLRAMAVAHCDIKPDNLIVCNTADGVRLFLIDMDQAVAFGGIRQVGTFETNMSSQLCNLGDQVNEYTDELGFLYIKNYIFLNWDQDYRR